MKAKGLAMTLGAVAALAGAPAAGQQYDYEAALRQYTRAIEYCNAFGYGTRRCQQNRDEVLAVCSTGRPEWCALADSIADDGGRQDPFPHVGVGPQGSAPGTPASPPAHQQPQGSAPGSIVGRPGLEAAPPKGQSAPVGEPAGEDFEEMLDRLTTN